MTTRVVIDRIDDSRRHSLWKVTSEWGGWKNSNPNGSDMADPEGKLTPVQHEIMETVWSAAEEGLTVSEIRDEIASSREVARTTVLNLVDRLEKRGWLTRREQKGANRFVAAVPRDQTVQNLAEDFVDDFFGGSASELVMSLLGSKRLKKADVEQLRGVLDERLSESKRRKKS